MKELIIVNIGGAGVKIGDKVWEKLQQQHSIKEYKKLQGQSLYNDQTMFIQLSQDSMWCPRNLFIDTSPEVIDQIRHNRRNSYNPNYFIAGKQDASNNYVRGHYTIGKNIIDDVDHQFDKLLQACDRVDGMVLNCAISGGTGSGLTNLFLDRIQNSSRLYKKTTVINSIAPSPRMANNIVEPYNFTLGIGGLIDADMENKVMVNYNNEQLYSICSERGIEAPGYNQINQIVASSITQILHKSRIRENASSVGEIAVNLVPYPNSFFLSPNLSYTHSQYDVGKTIKTIFQSKKCLNSYRSIGAEKIISLCAFMRGDMLGIDEINHLTAQKNGLNFFHWSPKGLKINISQINHKKTYDSNIFQSLTLINSNSMKNLLQIQHKKYDSLFQRRAFVHWYVGEGIQDSQIRVGRERTAQIDRDYEQMGLLFDDEQSIPDQQQIS